MWRSLLAATMVSAAVARPRAQCPGIQHAPDAAAKPVSAGDAAAPSRTTIAAPAAAAHPCSMATSPDLLQRLDAYWRAANYLCVGQIYRSYRPEELFDEAGRLRSELAALAPRGERRMGANPHANGGALLRDLRLPDFRAYAVALPAPGAIDGEDTKILGAFLRDVVRENGWTPAA
jgi:phosphoketolase